MGYHINSLKNKFKRLSIEIHHNRNKTSHKDNIIQSRDPNKPLLTLRVNEPNNSDSIQVEDTINEDGEEELEDEQQQQQNDDGRSDEILEQDQFVGFTNASEVDDEHVQEHFVHDTLLKSYRSSFKKISTGESNFFQEFKRQQCRCTCHEDAEGSLRNPIYHNQHCLSFCDNVQQPIKISDVVDHVNYIEPKKLSSKRKGFWFFKKKHPLAKIQDPKKRQQKDPIPDEDKQSTITSALERIEIIAQSTGGVENPTSVPKESDELTINDHKNDHQIEVNNTAKATSYARRYSKFGSPLISFSRSNSDYQKESPSSLNSKNRHNHHHPQQQQQKGSEPWKTIMNDISLHAALLSTGSRPILSKSSLNLVADFTSSKHSPQHQHQHHHHHQQIPHYEQQRSFSNNSGHSELISFRSIPAIQQLMYQRDDEMTINNENLFSGTILDNNNNNNNQNNDESNPFERSLIDESKMNKFNFDSRPSTTYKSKISVTSGPLEKDIYKGAETSAVYGGVFQDYINYSDESVEGWKELEQTSRSKLKSKEDHITTDINRDINHNNHSNSDNNNNREIFSSEILPLKISSKGLNRLF